jgi:hypothetical protein
MADLRTGRLLCGSRGPIPWPKSVIKATLSGHHTRFLMGSDPEIRDFTSLERFSIKRT